MNEIIMILNAITWPATIALSAFIFAIALVLKVLIEHIFDDS